MGAHPRDGSELVAARCERVGRGEQHLGRALHPEAAAAGAVVGGIGAIREGLSRRKEAEIHAESLRELSQSLGTEITPYVLDIEGRTIELVGTAEQQYTQWRKLLHDIYLEETRVE